MINSESVFIEMVKEITMFFRDKGTAIKNPFCRNFPIAKKIFLMKVIP